MHSSIGALARDDEQVRYWVRHTRTGMLLCLGLPVLVAAYAWLTPDHPQVLAITALAAAVTLSSPLLLLIPVERLVRHPRGGWFFYLWEACGVALVMVFSLLDEGARSPFVAIFYILLAHAALAYPPAGMAVTGLGTIWAYLGLAGVAGSPGTAELVFVVVTLAVAAANCAFASYNHVLAYRRTTAYAEQIAVLAERDGLTGCFNHRTFHQRLQAEAAVAGEGRPLALLLVDVDNFKQVNDTRGHLAGDAVLALIGAALERLSRAGDTAGRLGGDEFALLLTATPAEAAARVANRLCDEVRTTAAEYGVTVSVGVAVTLTRGEATPLLAEADRAIYRAKRGGRDQVAGVGDRGPAALTRSGRV